MGVELGKMDSVLIALGKELVIIERSVVSRDTEEIPHIDCLGTLFIGEQRLIHLLAVADADHLDVFLLAAEELAHCFGLRLDGASGGLLHEDVAVLAVLEGEEHQVHRFVEAHNESRHRRLGEGDGLVVADLVDPQGDDAPPAAHHVAVAGAADLGIQRVAALCHGHFLLERLADAHRVDGVRRLVGGQADHALDALVDGGVQDVVRADDVGLDRFHREEFAAGHLLEGGRVEDVVHAAHRAFEGGFVADVADVEFDLVGDVGVCGLVLVAHVVLLLLVAGEDADLLDVRGEEPFEYGIAETPGPPGDHQDLVLENGHMVLCVFVTFFDYPQGFITFVLGL